MIYFETQRLVFLDWKEQDLNEYQTMNKDTRVMKYLKIQKRRQISFTSEFKMNLEIMDMAFMQLKQNIITALLASIRQTSFHNLLLVLKLVGDLNMKHGVMDLQQREQRHV